MPRITIKQWPLVLEAGSDTVLEAALAAGVPYPHGCRTGECGGCKSKLLSGAVDMAAYDPTVLRAAERMAGLILACRARPRGDVQVAWLGADAQVDLPVQRVHAEVTNIEQVTRHIKRVYAWPERPLRFAAGQYARLRFGALPARSYSMANRPDEELLEFHIRIVPNGRVSEYLRTELQVGGPVRIEVPYGSAHLQPDHDGPIIAVAGGSGLAPIKSVVRTALHHRPDRNITLYFGVQDESDIYDEAELAALAARHPNLRLQIVLSAPGAPSTRRVANLSAVLEEELTSSADSRLYAAGPPAMVEAVAAVARERGIVPNRIHADPFYLSGAPESEAPEGMIAGLKRAAHAIRGLAAASWAKRAISD